MLTAKNGNSTNKKCTGDIYMSEIRRVYEDKDIIVCIKPEGVLSQKDSFGKTNMESLLGDVFCVHRLDREVSGVMVYAKNKKTAAVLSEQMQNGIFQKEYAAVIEGVPENDSGFLEDLLFKDSKKNKTFVVKRERIGVKYAKLHYETLISTDSISLVRVKLYTGRTHQIRVQFASRKRPIIGDKKYGSQHSGGIALYSHSLTFVHHDETVCFRYDSLSEVLKERFGFEDASI